MNVKEYVLQFLYGNCEEKYADFSQKLAPTLDRDCFIGVRNGTLRNFAKELIKRDDIGEFLADLPHKYYEENNLHGFILERIKNFDKCVEEVEKFLPYVNNWATCDTMSPKVFAKHKQELLPYIKKWIKSNQTYTVRFSIEMLMSHFLEEDFTLNTMEMVASVKSDEYYVKMMVAWYFATALYKQYDSAIKVIEDKTLEKWTHNKTIQKAIESYRITDEQKTYLRSLKV